MSIYIGIFTTETFKKSVLPCCIWCRCSSVVHEKTAGLLCEADQGCSMFYTTDSSHLQWLHHRAKKIYLRKVRTLALQCEEWEKKSVTNNHVSTKVIEEGSSSRAEIPLQPMERLQWSRGKVWGGRSGRDELLCIDQKCFCCCLYAGESKGVGNGIGKSSLGRGV